MMKQFNYLVIAFLMLLSLACQESEKPTVSFTFDDGITKDILDYKFQDWNERILNTLRAADLKAMFFVTGFNKTDKKGKFLLA